MSHKRMKPLSLLGVCLAFAQLPGTLLAVNFETFDLGWSGPAFTPAGGYVADTGSAVGTITFDIDNPTLAGSVTALNFTVTGSALPGYDGPHTLADYIAGPGSVTLTVGGPVIYTSSLLGQPITLHLVSANPSDPLTGFAGPNALSLNTPVPFSGALELILFAPNNGAQNSATTTGLPVAEVLGHSVLSAVQSTLSDVNNRLFNLRGGFAGGGYEEDEDPETIPTPAPSSGKNPVLRSGKNPAKPVADSGLGGAMDEGMLYGQGDGSSSPVTYRQPRSRQWTAYSTVNYGYVNLNSIRTQAGITSSTWAPGVGVDRRFGTHWTLGFAASLLESHQSYTNGLGSLQMEGPLLSTYLSYATRSFWSDILYSYGYLNLDLHRNPGFAFPAAFGSTNAQTNAVQYNTGWNFRFQNNTLVTGPFAGVDYLHATVAGYAETGGGAAALRYGRQSYDSLVTRVGWSVSKQLKTDFAVITPQVRLSYERQNVRNNNGTSVSLINQPFTATNNSQSPGQDYMVVGGGVNFAFNPAFSMLLSYQGQYFRQNTQTHYGSVRFSYSF